MHGRPLDILCVVQSPLPVSETLEEAANAVNWNRVLSGWLAPGFAATPAPCI
jgi:hypothetical protein